MNCKFAGYKGFGASPKRKSPARQVRRVRDFAGSVATLPMLARPFLPGGQIFSDGRLQHLGGELARLNR